MVFKKSNSLLYCRFFVGIVVFVQKFFAKNPCHHRPKSVLCVHIKKSSFAGSRRRHCSQNQNAAFRVPDRRDCVRYEFSVFRFIFSRNSFLQNNLTVYCCFHISNVKHKIVNVKQSIFCIPFYGSLQCLIAKIMLVTRTGRVFWSFQRILKLRILSSI